MIRNDRQYKISRARAEEFEALLTSEKTPARNQWADLELSAVRSQLKDLREEIDDYEKLKAGGITHFEIDSLDALPTVLVKARIASGLTQKQLAEKLGLKEQQIQRYEQNNYAGVSIDRIRQIIEALNVSVKQNIVLQPTQHSFHDLSERLTTLGIDKALLYNRFVPMSDTPMGEEGRFRALVERLSRVYGWQEKELLSGAQLELPSYALDHAQFKLPSKVDERRLNGYCIYAHYIALLALQATPHIQTKGLPADWKTARDQLLTKFGNCSLSAAIDYLWDLGVIIVPLFDSGLFHGACWRISGRNVIVLKQKTTATARWLVDVFHELYHLIMTSGSDLCVVEPAENQSPAAKFRDEEIDATEFAGDVLLAGRADELAVLCQHEANGHVERLKNAVVKVAQKEHVDVGVLANYMAYRLSEDKINWWGAATNLQPEQGDPSDLVRAKLLANSNLKILNEIDRNIFLTALKPLEEVVHGTNNQKTNKA